jgi:hypothetical protein
VGNARDKLEYMTQHSKGFGSKSRKELVEVIDWVRRAQEPGLLNSPEYVARKLEDTIGSCFALMHDVQNYLVRTALCGRVSADTRNHLHLKLLDAADRVKQLPTYGD